MKVLKELYLLKNIVFNSITCTVLCCSSLVELGMITTFAKYSRQTLDELLEKALVTTTTTTSASTSKSGAQAKGEMIIIEYFKMNILLNRIIC